MTRRVCVFFDTLWLNTGLKGVLQYDSLCVNHGMLSGFVEAGKKRVTAGDTFFNIDKLSF